MAGSRQVAASELPLVHVPIPTPRTAHEPSPETIDADSCTACCLADANFTVMAMIMTKRAMQECSRAGCGIVEAEGSCEREGSQSLISSRVCQTAKQNFRTVFPIPNDSERIRTKKPNGVQLPNGSRTLPNGFRTLPNGFPNDFVSICSLCGEYQQTALRCRPMLCLFLHPESKSASPWPRSPVEQHATPPMSFFWIFSSF